MDLQSVEYYSVKFILVAYQRHEILVLLEQS